MASVTGMRDSGSKMSKGVFIYVINSVLDPYRLISTFCTLKTIEEKIPEENTLVPWSKRSDTAKLCLFVAKGTGCHFYPMSDD